MRDPNIAELGASRQVDGVPLWQGVRKLSDEPGDVEPLGEAEVFQGLGLASMPFASDGNGRAEGLFLHGVNGRVAVCVGARDTRTSAIVGQLKGGDTALHSTDPGQSSQVQCKGVKRQVSLTTVDPDGKTMMLLLDGGTNKLQIVLGGMVLEMDGASQNITLSNGKCSILMQGGTICLDGDVILGGTIADPVNKIVVSALATPVPTPCSVSPAPGILVSSAKGVSIAI